MNFDQDYTRYKTCTFQNSKVGGNSIAENSVFTNCDTEQLVTMIGCVVIGDYSSSEAYDDVSANKHPDSTPEEYLKAMKHGGEIWKDGHMIFMGDSNSPSEARDED